MRYNNKKIRKAVRTFLINDNNVLCIEYKINDIGFIDIPGGKIEDNENSVQAAIREFKEETGIDIYNLEKIGNIIVEYPNRIYDIEVFLTYSYNGIPLEFSLNKSYWIPIMELVKKDNKYAITYLLESKFLKEFNDKKINMKFYADYDHRILKIENYN